ncbi:BCS1 N terminal-domain-containing protein [Chaetomium sp. MPI-SDFR-AT-0129]|nr:BCS1 N terminal-domain-containing protein [Chaetomium sp. MPI-SDFR-AT-0129]
MAEPTAAEGLPPQGTPPFQALDFFIPGFSVFSNLIQTYLHVDLNLYIPLALLLAGLLFTWRYFSDFAEHLIDKYLMSRCDVRVDDETFNYVMAWVSKQRFALKSRRFVVNTNTNSRSWHLWRSFHEDDDDEDDENNYSRDPANRKKKALAYTPTFGSHQFWYRNHLLIFRRTENTQQGAYGSASMREEISISCYGRNPWILKELLYEARDDYLKRDETKTAIYRGTTKAGSAEPEWQRCMSRTARPFSTVILNEKVKQELIDDVTDYLDPSTRRWYANRGIPYRRGYLLYGPPGTGKSSLSLALAGFFRMRIYMVSLSSVTANEENLASLFAELPRRCVVLLEDIDTAGLTHTREDGATTEGAAAPAGGTETPNNGGKPGPVVAVAGRLSLSGLLNILDGVASQEGRVLIMTTNHVEKLDKALIRPGRVDMIVKFDRADETMTAQIFKAIYAPLEGDETDGPTGKANGMTDAATTGVTTTEFLSSKLFKSTPLQPTVEDDKKQAEAAEAAAEAARKREETVAKVDALAVQFAARIPAHEFSPAEIQGFLLKNKREPEKAVEGAEQWVLTTRKEKKEKELRDAEEKREAEKKEKEEKEAKEKKEKKKKAKKAKKGKKSSKKSKKEESEESASGSSSSSESDASESEREKEKVKKKQPAAPDTTTTTDTTATATDTTATTTETPAAPVEPKKDETETKDEEDASASTPAVVVVTPPSTITVDTTAKAKEVSEGTDRTPGADSGYGTPS